MKAAARRPTRTLMVVVLGAVAAAACPDRIPRLDPNASGFPDASIPDCSDLLNPPAGRRGLMFVGTDGRFYFEDGTRARFFGINVAKDSVFQPREVIDEAVAAIARAGFNLVRLHHLDDEGGLLPPTLAGARQRIDPKKLDAVDYWIARLRERGIYVYLDLLDYRTFRVEEGIPAGPELGRGAKPCAVFNERLVELQRDYARQLLLEHVNPYTGLTYAQDPAVCMLELCDENGLFHEQSRLGKLPGPYREELLRRWNFWLLSQFGSRAALARLWTDETGKCWLGEAEDPRANSVGLPGLTPEIDTSTARVATAYMFFASLHREYFRAMRSFLTAHGVRCPITAVTKPEMLPDLWAAAQELDFIATNYYFDHPYFPSESAWKLPGFFNGKNVLRDETGAAFGPQISAVRVAGKPLVVREWGVCWPNESRAPGMIEATAYACLQDVDALILFTLDTRPEAGKLDFFDVRRDPTRWGLASQCARMFLGPQVQPAQRSVELAYSDADVFWGKGGTLPTPFHELSRVSRLAARFCGSECRGGPDLTVTSGRTSGIRVACDHAVICSNSRATDALGNGRDSAAARSGYPAPLAAPREVMRFRFGGTLFPAGAVRDIANPRPFDMALVRGNSQWRPIGVSADERYCFGIRDMLHKRYVFGSLDEGTKLRAALDALGQLYGGGIGHGQVDRRCFSSDTGELIVDHAAGVLWVNAPLCASISGELADSEARSSGPLTVRTDTPLAACVWQSLDGREAEASRRWVLKLVSIARNTGQQVRVHLEKKDQRILALDAAGREPVITAGMPSDRPTVLSLSGRTLARIFLRNGVFELCRAGGRLYVYCDTPGARVELPGLAATTPVLVHRAGSVSPTRGRLDQALTWGSETILVEIPLPEGS